MASAFVFHAYSPIEQYLQMRKTQTFATFVTSVQKLNRITGGSTRSSFLTDLIEKALRKLAGEALRNEIDVIAAWLCSYSVSPPRGRVYSPVVTYFILACPANF